MTAPEDLGTKEGREKFKKALKRLLRRFGVDCLSIGNLSDIGGLLYGWECFECNIPRQQLCKHFHDSLVVEAWTEYGIQVTFNRVNAVPIDPLTEEDFPEEKFTTWEEEYGEITHEDIPSFFKDLVVGDKSWPK